MTHTYFCPMRWGDMDAQGHVNNGAYLDYLQEARVDFLMADHDVLAKLLGTGVLVTGHQVEYLRPVTFSDRPLRIELGINQVGGARFSVGYEVFDGEELAARARTTAAPFDLATATLRRLTAGEREALQAAAAPAEPLRALAKVRLNDSVPTYRLAVRWSDLDSYGHVNNVKFFDYVQEARVALLREALDWQPVDVWVIARQDVEYHRPLDFRTQPYQVRTAVTAIGTRSFTLAAEVLDPDDGQIFATARTVVVGERPLTEAQRVTLDEISAPARPQDQIVAALAR